MLETKKRSGAATTTYASRNKRKDGDMSTRLNGPPPISPSSPGSGSEAEDLLAAHDSVPGLARGSEPVTQENFVFKVLEVLKPAAPKQQPPGEAADEEESVEEKRHCVRNVHELLEAGSANRLCEEVEYIVAGLEALPKRGRLRERLVYYEELLGLLLGGRLLTCMEMSTLRTTGIVSRLAVFVGGLEDVLDEEQVAGDGIGSYRLIVLLANALYGGHQYGKDDVIVMAGLAARVAISLLSSNDLVDMVVTDEWRQRLSSDSYAELAVWFLHRIIVSWQMRRSTGDTGLVLDTTPGTLKVIIRECGRMIMSSECANLRACILGILLHLFEAQGECRDAIHAVCIDYFGNARNPLDSQHPACLLTGLGLLVAITGPDEGARRVCDCPLILQAVKRLFLNPSVSSEIDTLIAAIITNIVDRHPNSRHVYKGDDEFMDLLIDRVRQPDGSGARLYQGMMLGILLFDDELARQSYTARYRGLLARIGQCFHGLVQYLSGLGSLTPLMQSQLAIFSQPYTGGEAEN